MQTLSLSEEMTNYRSILSEAWDKKMDTPANKKGMFKGKTKAELRSELAAAKKRSAALHEKGEKEPESLKTKIKELEFALRAKNSFGKVSEGNELLEGAGSSFEHLLKQHHQDVDAFILGDDLSTNLYNALYEYYFDEMPYGVAKARTGDPMQWISEKFYKDLETEGLAEPMDTIQSGSLPNIDPAIALNQRIGEGKTMRKCKGKGCDKKCPDGKNYCSKKCQTNTSDLKKPVAINKKLKEYAPGPFSKNGYVAETAKKKSHEQKDCKLCNGKLSAKECAAKLDSEGNVKKDKKK
jgi:hypothetical protein